MDLKKSKEITENEAQSNIDAEEHLRKSKAIKDKFSRIEDIIADPKFEELLQSEINKLTTERKKLKSILKAGKRLRRTTFDRLEEKGEMNSDSIISEYRNIVNGISTQPSIIRTYIIQIISNISKQVLSFYYEVI
jgi:hypothetical protein